VSWEQLITTLLLPMLHLQPIMQILLHLLATVKFPGKVGLILPKQLQLLLLFPPSRAGAPASPLTSVRERATRLIFHRYLTPIFSHFHSPFIYNTTDSSAENNALREQLEAQQRDLRRLQGEHDALSLSLLSHSLFFLFPAFVPFANPPPPPPSPRPLCNH
jgi:hypothetical protein